MAILKGRELAKRASIEYPSNERIIVVPDPGFDALSRSGAAAIDLRLGRWVTSLRNDAISKLDIIDSDDREQTEFAHTKRYFIPFNGTFILQPRSFVLGVTLEWIRLPDNVAGYLTARSRIGRRGLIIATAAGVHPGFSGCLTLELSNVSEIPIVLRPGLSICQLFLHDAPGERVPFHSVFSGSRIPILGPLERDETARKLAEKQ